MEKREIMDECYSLVGVLGLEDEVYRMELCGVSESDILCYLESAYEKFLHGVRESMISALAAYRIERLTAEAMEACAGQGAELTAAESRNLIGETVKRLASRTEPLFKQAVSRIMEDVNFYKFDA
jgi:hypothetical protein